MGDAPLAREPGRDQEAPSSETYDASAERNRKLFAEGLVPEEVFRQAKLDAARTRLELAGVGNTRDLAVRSAAAQEEALRLRDGHATKKEVREAERQIRFATAAGQRGPGVVTWVLPDAGASVRRGDALARVADLSSYRIEATVADVHATKLRAGLPALRQGERREARPGRFARILRGRIPTGPSRWG